MQDPEDLMNDFDSAAKSKQLACKTLRVWTKNEENFEKFQFWDFLIKISMENWLFSQFLTKYFLDFWLRSESIDIWKITPDFYNNFSYFGGGDVPAFPPPPDATGGPKTQPNLEILLRMQKFVSSHVSWKLSNKLGRTNKSGHFCLL